MINQLANCELSDFAEQIDDEFQHKLEGVYGDADIAAGTPTQHATNLFLLAALERLTREVMELKAK